MLTERADAVHAGQGLHSEQRVQSESAGVADVARQPGGQVLPTPRRPDRRRRLAREYILEQLA